MTKYIVIALLLIVGVVAVKVMPLSTLTQESFEAKVQCDLETFLEKGSQRGINILLLFKIPECKYCEHAELLFQSFYMQYYRRKFQLQEIQRIERNFMIAMIDCNESYMMCSRLNVPHYPYYLVFEQNGEACNYEGSPQPSQIIGYLEDRFKDNKYEKCEYIGRISIVSNLLDYFEPITNLFNEHVLLFIVAFVICPFLFGFVFSRNKKTKEQILNGAVKIQKGQ